MSIHQDPQFRNQYSCGVPKDKRLEKALAGEEDATQPVMTPVVRKLDPREALRAAVTGNKNPNLRGWG